MVQNSITSMSLTDSQLADLKDRKLDICEILAEKSKASAVRAPAGAFFKSDDNEGYITKEGFITHISNLSDKDRNNFNLLLEYQKSKLKLNCLPIVKTDKAGNKYLWLKFIMPSSTQEFKFIVVEDLDRFIKHYQQGVITPSFTLTELFLEAHS